MLGQPMSNAATKYTSHMAVTIGASSTVEIPPRVFCVRLTGFLFDTDKSFLLPGALAGIKEIKRFYDDHPRLEVLVSGHADRAGAADYNLNVSNERAEAIEAYLQDQADRWLPWYQSSKPASKRWGVLEDQHMLSALGHYAGPVHGRDDAATKAAAKDFRSANGLGEGGIDDTTRRKLVEKYMQVDGTTLPSGTKIQHHGCGEYHPRVATADGVAEGENRRVEVFLFEGPVDPPPPATCPARGCSQYPEWNKRVVETIDLRVRDDLMRITVALRNRAAELIERAPYRMSAAGRSCSGRATGGQATLLVPQDAERCLVEWGREGDPDMRQDGGATTFSMELYLHYDVGSDEEQARMRLHNLGYPDSQPFDEVLRMFQEDGKLPETGTLDAATRDKLIEVHGALAQPAGASRTTAGHG